MLKLFKRMMKMLNLKYKKRRKLKREIKVHCAARCKRWVARRLRHGRVNFHRARVPGNSGISRAKIDYSP